jgi:hypothetical protein
LSRLCYKKGRSLVRAETDPVIAYYSLAAGAIAVDRRAEPFAAEHARSDPDDGAWPVGRRSGLAGHGAWPVLLRDAVLRTMQAAGIVGVRGILVHALSPAAKHFYETFGFRESPANPMTLMAALHDVAATLRGEQRKNSVWHRRRQARPNLGRCARPRPTPSPTRRSR